MIQAIIAARPYMKHSADEYIQDFMTRYGYDRDRATSEVLKALYAHPQR